jgi:AraC family transcriptional regulator
VRDATVSLAHSIRSNFSAPLQIADYCCKRSVGYYDVLRVFAQLTGCTPLRFMQSFRITSAKQLLTNCQLSVTDVCYEVGYESLGTFTRTFTALVGLGPKAFRLLSVSIRSWDMGYLLTRLQGAMPPLESSTTIQGYLSAPTNSPRITLVGLFETGIPVGQA